MSVEITGIDPLVARLRRFGDVRTLKTPVKKAMIRAGSLLANQMRIEYRKSGLRRRTGDLANSIDFEIRETSKGPELLVGSFGVRYAAIHEFGFTGVQNVPAHTRNISQAFGRPIDPRAVQVRPHVRQQNIPARPFIRPALDVQQSRVADIIAKALTSGK